MTDSNENNSRLDRIEAIVESNSRTIQAILEQRATDRLLHEDRMAKYDIEIAELKEIASRITDVQRGMARMLGNINETNPTILRRLMTIENKVDRILERDKD